MQTFCRNTQKLFILLSGGCQMFLNGTKTWLLTSIFQHLRILNNTSFINQKGRSF